MPTVDLENVTIAYDVTGEPAAAPVVLVAGYYIASALI